MKKKSSLYLEDCVLGLKTWMLLVSRVFKFMKGESQKYFTVVRWKMLWNSKTHHYLWVKSEFLYYSFINVVLWFCFRWVKWIQYAYCRWSLIFVSVHFFIRSYSTHLIFNKIGLLGTTRYSCISFGWHFKWYTQHLQGIHVLCWCPLFEWFIFWWVVFNL